MPIKEDYRSFVADMAAAGSGTPTSYVRAMDITDEALKKDGRFMNSDESLWNIRDENRLRDLLGHVLQSQNTTDGGIYRDVIAKSYWKKKFCSAALSKFIVFVASLP